MDHDGDFGVDRIGYVKGEIELRLALGAIGFFVERRESVLGGSHENILVFERPQKSQTRPSPAGGGEGDEKEMFAIERSQTSFFKLELSW